MLLQFKLVGLKTQQECYEKSWILRGLRDKKRSVTFVAAIIYCQDAGFYHLTGSDRFLIIVWIQMLVKL